MVEPPQIDIRTTIPWGIKTASGSYATMPAGLTSGNATGMPLDPLATDSSGNLLCPTTYSASNPCVQGSSNRRKAKHKLARLHARIKHVRLDVLHKTTTDLTSRFGTIVLETLNVKGMMANGHLSSAAAFL